MSDLLHDVDEALRQEKIEKFWKENGPYVLLGVILLVIFTGAFTAYNSWKTNKNAAQTATLLTAMRADDPAAALAAAEKSLSGDHRAMDLIQLAALKSQSGKTDEAVALLDRAANDTGLRPMWRDLATLWSVRTQWGNGGKGGKPLSAEKAKPLFERLKPLTEKSNLWHLQADLQAAMIAGDSLNDPKTARGFLRDILEDEGAPPSMKDRARALQGLYIEASEKPKSSDTEGAVPKG